MNRLLYLLAFLCLPAWGMQQYQDVTVDRYGNRIGNATVVVKDHFTGVVARLFSTARGTATLSNPLTSNADASYSFFVASGAYDITVTAGGTSYTIANKQFFDPTDDIGGLNAINYGAIGDGRVATDCTITSGQAVVTSASMAFSSADVGKLLVIADATFTNTHVTVGTINSVSGNTATISSTASSTISTSNCAVGTDNLTPMTNAIAALMTVPASGSQPGYSNALLNVPAGIYLMSNQIRIPDGGEIRGAGGYSPFPGTMPTQGTVFIAAGAAISNYLVKVGQTPDTSALSGSVIRGVAIDCAYLCNYPLWVHGFHALVTEMTLQRGVTQGALVDGVAVLFHGNYVMQHGSGDGVRALATDGEFSNNEMRGVGNGNAIFLLDNGTASIRVLNNNIYRGNTAGTTCNDIQIKSTAGANQTDYLILGNAISVCIGHKITITATGAGSAVQMVNVVGNFIYDTDGVNFTDNTFDWVNTNASSSGAIVGLNISNNMAVIPLQSNSYRTIWTDSGGVATTGVNITGNVARNVKLISPAGVAIPGINWGNQIRPGGTATFLLSNNRGVSTQSGNGVTTAFTIAHGLADTPQKCNIGASKPAAQAASTVTFDATNITVTFSAAPANSANNLQFNWDCTL